MNSITIIELGNEIEKKVTQIGDLNKINKSDFLEVFYIELNQTDLDIRTTQRLLSKIKNSIDCT